MLLWYLPFQCTEKHAFKLHCVSEAWCSDILRGLLGRNRIQQKEVNFQIKTRVEIKVDELKSGTNPPENQKKFNERSMHYYVWLCPLLHHLQNKSIYSSFLSL